jgi:hypothetical protein
VTLKYYGNILVIMNKNSFRTEYSIAAITISSIVVGSAALSLHTTLVQNAFAQTAAEIEEKNLREARSALQEGNTTSAIDNILTILEWEFKEVHPSEAAESPGGNVSAGE